MLLLCCCSSHRMRGTHICVSLKVLFLHFLIKKKVLYTCVKTEQAVKTHHIGILSYRAPLSEAVYENEQDTTGVYLHFTI